MATIKHIGVFCSGGDAPGMNAAVRAVVRTAIQANLKVSGIIGGYQGMIDGNFMPMYSHTVGNIIHRGGTILKSARSKDFHTKEGRAKAMEQLKLHQLDALIAIGGDGTLKGATLFTQEHQIPFIGLPGTIDNDLNGTDFTIGYDTAVQTAVECIDKVRDTAQSHNRIFFIEVMGRDVGTIALASGIAAGAEDILIPETVTNIQQIAARINANHHKQSYLIIVAEGDEAGGAMAIANDFQQQNPNYDVKTLILGHLLRGGSPTANDRILASRLGVAAVDELLKENYNHMIGIHHNKIITTPFEQCTKHLLEINKEYQNLLYKLSY
ncbi:MAG: 6-phosphofructokinase [Chitinophagales bacterium]|nr:6-phosphofructokinase [Chitinophagales bacterium]